MLNNIKKWVLPLACIYGLFVLYEEVTGDFRIANITYDLPYQAAWDSSPLDVKEQARIDQLLDQPFHFLGKGNQSYAFESQDQKYVLKFFRFKHLKPSWFLEWMPAIPFLAEDQKKKERSKQKRLERVFRSYKIAYALDQDNTGVLFIHLNRSKHLQQTMTVIDKLGFKHSVELDSTIFILQEKGRICKEVLGELLKKRKVSETKQKIRALLDMYVSEYKRGLYDKDYNLMHNTGFLNEKPFRLDAGRLHYCEEMKIPSIYISDLEKIAATRIDKWLKSYFPAYRQEILRDVEEKIQEIAHAADLPRTL